MGTTCRECEAGQGLGWVHCHGTLIRHWLGRAECTDQDCPDADLMAHSLVIDCDAAGCPCAQPIGSAADSAGWAASG